MSYGEETEPLAIAHRGGAALGPENTLAAFAMSTALGLRYLESDVRLTADGHLVCFHDETLDRITTGRGGSAPGPSATSTDTSGSAAASGSPPSRRRS